MATVSLDELAARLQRPPESLVEFQAASRAQLQVLSAATNAALLREECELRSALNCALGKPLGWLLQKWLAPQ